MVSFVELAVLSFIGSVGVSGLEHGHHKHKFALFDESIPSLEKRGGNDCEFPTDKGLVAVNKDGTGAGWAISKDQTCQSGHWCPYACPPGYVAAQWDPEVTSYTYPGSQYGGLKCNSDGSLSKGFSNKDYCVKGKGTLKAKNTVGKDVAFCQTVLPGNEEMLIPTNVEGNKEATLAVPGTDYWASTAAHYYINSPGISTTDACTWGSSDKAQGNWSPYVAGVNQDDGENTFVKIGWNPIYLDSSFKNTQPDFGIRITCDDESKCNGLKCEIDPTKGINKIQGSTTSGAGDANFCVVTAEKGTTAKIEIFSTNSNSKRSFNLENNVQNLAKNLENKIQNFNATSLSTSATFAPTKAASTNTSASANSTATAVVTSGATKSNTFKSLALVFSFVMIQTLI